MSEAIGEDQPCWLVLTKRVRKSMSNRISLEIKISCARLDQNCLADLDSGDGGGNQPVIVLAMNEPKCLRHASR